MTTVKELRDGFEPLPLDLQGWNSTAPVFKELVTDVKPLVILEVGSWKGASAIHMAHICKELGLVTKIYCVDTWLGAKEFWTMTTPERDLMLKHGYPQVYYQFLSNVIHEGVDEMIVPIPATSSVGASLVPQADLIYIDASHEYEDVKRDIEYYWKRLRKGGVMFGDDYGNTVFPGVKKAVDEWDFAVTNNWHWVCKK